MATRFCTRCGGEFIATVERCPDCDLELVDERPDDEEGGRGEDGALEGEVGYDLNEWAVESRMMLKQLLSSAGIRHAWEGAELVVAAADEVRVDGFVDQVEATTVPTLDPDAPKVAYDIEDWTDAQQTRLMHLLEQGAIPYEFDAEGLLVVLEEHERRAEALLDRVEYPDGRPDAATSAGDEAAGAGGGDDDQDAVGVGTAAEGAGDDDALDDDLDELFDDDGYDGPEAMDVLSDLFVAADRLRHSATDAEGVLGVVDRTADATRLPLPYGFAPAVWKDIVRQVVALRDLLEDDESRDDDIEEHARDLRETLRQYV